MARVTISSRFVEDFSHTELITMDDIRTWYLAIKEGDTSYVYDSALYSLIINPLLNKGMMRRVEKGVYTITNIEEKPKKIKVKYSPEEPDDFDTYIKKKIEEANDDKESNIKA